MNKKLSVWATYNTMIGRHMWEKANSVTDRSFKYRNRCSKTEHHFSVLNTRYGFTAINNIIESLTWLM